MNRWTYRKVTEYAERQVESNTGEGTYTRTGRQKYRWGIRRRAGRQEYHRMNNNMQKDWQTGIVQREYADVHCTGIQVYRNTLMYFKKDRKAEIGRRHMQDRWTGKQVKGQMQKKSYRQESRWTDMQKDSMTEILWMCIQKN
jgi:hypothetical protein